MSKSGRFFLPKNRRGFLLAEETLKIVIAVISISFLIFFLTSLYFSKINEQKKQHAEATLKRIIEIVENAQSNIEELNDPSPSGWYLFSFVKNIKKPNSCASKNCLCICDKVIDFFSEQIKECDSGGVCKIVENLGDFEKIEIKKTPFALEIIKDTELNKIIIKEK